MCAYVCVCMLACECVYVHALADISKDKGYSEMRPGELEVDSDKAVSIGHRMQWVSGPMLIPAHPGEEAWGDGSSVHECRANP